VAATITAHHLLLNRNALFLGGIRPHHYCLPVLKREEHREALVDAATSAMPKFFLGTDSAPHARGPRRRLRLRRHLHAHAAIELYAAAFEEAGALDKLEGFASHHGADFYGLPRNSGTIDAAARGMDRAEDAALRQRGAGAAARRRDHPVEAGLKLTRSSIPFESIC
jgi:dihydroorotase